MEARVARVFKLGWSGEIAIGAASGEVSGEIPVKTAPADIEVERSGIQRTAEERIAGLESRIGEGIGGFGDARAAVGRVGGKIQPMERRRFHGNVHTTG